MTTPTPAPLSSYTLTLNEAATLLDVSTKTLQRAVKAGRLSCIRVPARRGHELRFRPDEVRTLAVVTAPLPPVEPPVASKPPKAAVSPKPETRKPDKKAASARKPARRDEMDDVAARLALVSERLESVDVRMEGVADQQEALAAALAGLPRLSSDVQTSIAQQQAILDALTELPRQLAAHSERLASLSAEAAAYRERTAWLEGTLAETTRELAEARTAQIAAPEHTEVPVEPGPATELAPQPPPQPRKGWWRRLVGG